MDCGEDIKRRRGHLAETKMAAAMTQNAAQMMAKWTADNFYAYVETMEMIRQNAPVHWAKLYQEAIKMGLAKETNININFNRQQDREGLQGLVRARMLTDQGSYVPYEEIRTPVPSAFPEGHHPAIKREEDR